MDKTVLRVEQLNVQVQEAGASKYLVKDVSFEVSQKNIVALVGGSGSGKTTTGLAVMRLLAPALTVTGGHIYFQEQDVLAMPLDQIQQMRGRSVAMIFQEPLHAFNPVLTIGYQIDEVLRYHTTLKKVKRAQKILALLDQVGLPDPGRVVKSYAHQLSGGMRQRAMIAQAIALEPVLLIADEPTSSLDVTLQARIMELFQQLRQNMGLSILLITHDLGLVAHSADHVVVLRQGKVVEAGEVTNIMTSSEHEYTRRLILAAQ